MTDNDTVLELYNRGISAHDLRSSYVGDQLGDNPYASVSRQQIKYERTRLNKVSLLTGQEMDEELLDLLDVLDALKKAEPRASEALRRGQVIGLGVTDAHDLSLKIVPRLQWPLLIMDFDKSSASGRELDYAGLQFVFRDELTEDQVQNLEATSKSTAGRRTEVTQSRSLSDLNISTWGDLYMRFVKNKYVVVGGPEKEQEFFFGDMGLLDRTTKQENKACVALLQMANRVIVTTNEKHTVSNLRQLLRNLFGLSSDPFHIERGRYVPNFKLLYNRDAADRRAKKRAVHVPFNDEQQVDDQDGHSYEEDSEMQNDDASAWLEKEMSR